MKIGTTLLIAALAATGGACKKKDKGSTATTDPGSGTPKPNEGSGATKPPEPEKEKPLVGDALAKKYISCVGMVNDAKYDDFKKDCMAADFKGHMADGPDVPNVDAVIGYFKAMKTGFPDWKLTPQLVLINGRDILAIELSTGTNTADWKSPDGHDMKKTDKKIGLLMFHRLTINDENKATEEWVYEDPGTMMGQLGLLPKEAPPMRPATEASWEGAPIIVVAADDDKEKANLELCKKSDAAFNDHKTADMFAMTTDDAIESDQASGKDNKGKKELEAGLKMFMTAFPDMKLTPEHTFAAGDWVVDIGTATGTNKGPMGKMKPTNKEVTMHYAEVDKIKDGKVAEMWRFRNGMAMAMQMGLIPDAPKAGDAGDPKVADPKAADPKTVKKADPKGGDMKGGW